MLRRLAWISPAGVFSVGLFLLLGATVGICADDSAAPLPRYKLQVG
ncbi:MAG TPA: hypothetical protein VMJ32_05545 [Pirellulales bacterium]|nr:hypothetical protein [Pirellulales bacterium]